MTVQDQISTSRDADAKVKLRDAIPTGEQHELGRPTWRHELEPDGKSAIGLAFTSSSPLERSWLSFESLASLMPDSTRS